jgi:hypothetical protein
MNEIYNLKLNQQVTCIQNFIVKNNLNNFTFKKNQSYTITDIHYISEISKIIEVKINNIWWFCLESNKSYDQYMKPYFYKYFSTNICPY